jgi:hypothetical protein
MRLFPSLFGFAGFRQFLFLLGTSFLLQQNSPAAEPASGGIEWKLMAVEDEDGDWWNAFQIETVPGVRYDIEKSGDLQSPWQTVASYYGGGAQVIHPLFPGLEPMVPPAGTPPVVPPPGFTPLLHKSFFLKCNERSFSNSNIVGLSLLLSQGRRRICHAPGGREGIPHC